MKKALFALMCLAAMLAAGTSLKAQEVTIMLTPGWTWISNPTTDTIAITEAFGPFAPMQGDIIKSQWGNSKYLNGQWRGVVSKFYPGYGYKYYSNREMPVTVTMGEPLPFEAVSTAEPSDVTATSATVGGTVSVSEGNHVFVRGVCWGTEEMPDVDGSHATGAAEAGSQTISLDGLTPGTTYHVRAYMVTDHGLSYGEAVSFTTLEGDGGSSTAPIGAIDGKFTINEDGGQIYFSQGNLQYQASTNTWKFAESQYDYIGDANSNLFALSVMLRFDFMC